MFRRPFTDVVARQLDLYAAAEADGLLVAVTEAKQAYDRAAREEAEEAYGDYDDARIAAAEGLAELRDRYAATLDEGTADRYCAAFNRAAARRWPALAAEISAT
jgi:hypothetical protein